MNMISCANFVVIALAGVFADSISGTVCAWCLERHCYTLVSRPPHIVQYLFSCALGSGTLGEQHASLHDYGVLLTVVYMRTDMPCPGN